MPTISQLINHGRKAKTTKSKAPALGMMFNTLHKKETRIPSPFKRGVCTRVATMTPKNLTQLFVNMLVLSYQMVKKLPPIFLAKDTIYKNTQ